LRKIDYLVFAEVVAGKRASRG
jgi:two-component system, response regulator YesN